MKKEGRWYNVEVFVDRLIPYALAVLLVFIVLEVFFAARFQYYSFFVSALDGFVIGIFILDLFFKYRHIRSVPRFLRTYFLEILALLPAVLIVRALEEFLVVTGMDDAIKFSQEALEVSQKTGLGPTRVSYFSRLILPVARIPRFLAAFHFYEKPTHRHLHKHIYKNLVKMKNKKK